MRKIPSANSFRGLYARQIQRRCRCIRVLKTIAGQKPIDRRCCARLCITSHAFVGIPFFMKHFTTYSRYWLIFHSSLLTAVDVDYILDLSDRNIRAFVLYRLGVVSWRSSRMPRWPTFNLCPRTLRLKTSEMPTRSLRLNLRPLSPL